MGSSSHLSKRKKKRSQKRSKKRIKSSGEKSKKRIRRHDSDSFSDEGSVDVLSVSCSSSDDEYRSRSKSKSKRGRLRDRKDKKEKDRKKRVKRSRLVSESSGDETDCVKKQKRLRKSKGSESKKKRSGKKRMRDPSISSLSGRSRSPSPFEHSDGNERESGRKERKEGKRSDKCKRSGSEESKDRWRSCSPCSVRSDGCILSSEEKVMENKSIRLKSVIVATEEREEAEVRGSEWDGKGDEFFYEHDDYPSKSNDSNDGVAKREVSAVSHDASSVKPKPLDDSARGAVAVNIRDSGFPASQILVGKTSPAMSSSNVSSVVNSQSEGGRDEAHNANAGSSRSDLESSLRQKALENLLKRHGKVPIKTPPVKKGDSESEKSSSALTTDRVQHMPDDRFIKPVQKVAKVDSTTYVSSAPKGNDACVPTGGLGTGYQAVACKASGDPVETLESRPKLALSMPRKDFVGGRNTWRRQVILQEVSQPRPSSTGKPSDGIKPQLISQKSSQLSLSEPKEAVNFDLTKGSGSLSPKTKESTEKLDNVADPEPSATSGKSSIEKTDGPDDGSGFQKKTMSVMRGGELVEVSYKVYIPKKAPALARRRLKR